MVYDSKEDSLREMEKLMDLKEGELDNQFTQLSSLSCCTVISQILKEVTGGLAVAPAALQRSYRGEKRLCNSCYYCTYGFTFIIFRGS